MIRELVGSRPVQWHHMISRLACSRVGKLMLPHYIGARSHFCVCVSRFSRELVCLDMFRLSSARLSSHCFALLCLACLFCALLCCAVVLCCGVVCVCCVVFCLFVFCLLACLLVCLFVCLFVCLSVCTFLLGRGCSHSENRCCHTALIINKTQTIHDDIDVQR